MPEGWAEPLADTGLPEEETWDGDRIPSDEDDDETD
jgi:hypothetical protein